MYIPNTRWTWAFTLVALGQALISWALEIYIFVKFQIALNPNARGDISNVPPPALDIPTYLALFIFGFLYELILVWDALRLKNTIQVIGICIYNVGILIYASVEMSQVKDAIGNLSSGQFPDRIDPVVYPNIKPYLIAAPCVIALGTVLLSLIAWKLYDEFAWTIYKHVSADIRLRRRFLTYQIYIALLKFDFFFFLGFTVQFLVVVQGTSTAEFAITIAAIPITIILLVLAGYITRRESYLGQCAVMALYGAAMAYFIYKLVRMYSSAKEQDYIDARHSLTVFAVLTLLLLVITIVTACFCMANFNKGLRPHIQRRKVPNPGESDDTKYGNPYFAEDAVGSPHQLGPLQTRMTID